MKRKLSPRSKHVNSKTSLPAGSKTSPPAASMNAYLQNFYHQLPEEDHFYLFSRAIEQSPIAIIITNPSGLVEYMNPRFSQLIAASQIPNNQHLQDITQNPFTGELFTQIWQMIKSEDKFQDEIRLHRQSGEVFWESVIIKPISDYKGKPSHFIIFLEDITERKLSEARIEHLVKHDSLTNLPNRELFNVQLRLAMENSLAANNKLAICILGLDRFKVVNNTLGHNAGDQIIKAVAARLSSSSDSRDILARMGGDEFILLLADLQSFQAAVKKADQIMALFKTPFIFEGLTLHINASIGISLFPEDGPDPLTLLKNADAALNEAKESGRNVYKFFTAKLSTLAPDQLALETEFRNALEQNELMVYYQPQVDFMTGQVVGMEALVRWQHPQRGLVPPDKFIPLAEETGLIVPMGKYVLEAACRQNYAWHQAGFNNLRMAVNLSARQFQEPELVETVLNICKLSNLDPHFLELEITESIFMKDLSITAMILQWFSKKGIRIAIDDFGTGYSSLTYLRRFPISTLKIDRSFIRDCLTDSENRAIVSTIASIAKNLDLRITAEGVENIDQFSFLRHLKCNDFQGYLFSPALSADKITQLLQENRTLDVSGFPAE